MSEKRKSAVWTERGDAYPSDAELAAWPNCETPDCDKKCCMWSGTVLCFPCAERQLGREEMIRRFDATHEKSWAECLAEDSGC